MFTNTDVEEFYTLGTSYAKVSELNKTRELALSFRDKVKSLYIDNQDKEYYDNVAKLEFLKHEAIFECVKGSEEYKKVGNRAIGYYGSLQEKQDIINKLKSENENMDEIAIELAEYKPGYATVEFYTIAFAVLWVQAIKNDLIFINSPINEKNIKQEMINSLPFLNAFTTVINNAAKQDSRGVLPNIKMEPEERKKAHARAILNTFIAEVYGLDALGMACRLSEGLLDKFTIELDEDFDVDTESMRKVMNYKTFMINDEAFAALTNDDKHFWASRQNLQFSKAVNWQEDNIHLQDFETDEEEILETT